MGKESLIERVEEAIEKPDSEKLPLPKITELPNSFVEITESLRHISGRWSAVEIFTASEESRALEKEKLFQSYKNKEEYNPVFEYDAAEAFSLGDSVERLRELLKRVRKFEPSNQEERLGRISLYFKIKDDLATANLTEALKEKDDKKAGNALKEKYPGVDKDLTYKADEIYEELCIDSEKERRNTTLSNEEQEYLKNTEVDAEEIKEAFEWALNQYRIPTDGKGEGFKVIVSNKVTSIDVRDKSSEGPTVFIPKDRIVSLEKLMGLIAHEIEGHVRQSINGRKLFLIGGGPLMGDNDMLYEGLGMRYETRIMDKFFGEKENTPPPFFTFAVKAAEKGDSFYKIFSDQVTRRLHVGLKIDPKVEIDTSKVDEKELRKAMDVAWLTTYRIMRGHIDTSNPNSYANAKDLAYLRGWMLDKDLIKIDAGYLNEAGVIHYKALKLIAKFDLSEEDLPIPFKDVASDYWEQVLKPRMQ